jgi:hypothetical protein
MSLNQNDIDQILEHGLSLEEVGKQLQLFRNGVQPLPLVRAATIGDGILKLNEKEKEVYARFFTEHAAELDVVKFIPASGAATRMFKDLYDFVENGKSSVTVDQFFKDIEAFSFFERIKTDFGYPGDKAELLRFLLGEKGLKFGQLPKGLLPFHKYEGKVITPIESHIHEAADYATGEDGSIKVHFTLSPEHLENAEKLIWETVFQMEDKYGMESMIQLSEQCNSTDTIAVDDQNQPFRDASGKLVFRPGGHGALLKNLSETDGEIVFLRNIDNILPPHRKTENVFYKKVLGGYLLFLRQTIFHFLQELEQNNTEIIPELLAFAKTHLFVDLAKTADVKSYFHFLNRPIRVCGMVKNEGEPGGGPFWAKTEQGISLQIVESSQVALTADQQAILKSATHFNPVDLVCCLKDFRGEKFDLKHFVDAGTSLIVAKSMNGKPLKALEHPGLWNGSMSGWITVFVEIPVSTFNPVKIINDLLRENHRN